MESQNKKSKTYVIIFIVMVLFAIVLTITKKANAPVIEVKQSNNANTEILGNKNDLVSFSIKPGEKVSGITKIIGSVQGGYFFEANILVNILDADKNILKSGQANATADWMTSGPVSFEGDADFSGLPSGPAYIEIHNDNASGLPENDKSILIPVIIE